MLSFAFPQSEFFMNKEVSNQIEMSRMNFKVVESMEDKKHCDVLFLSLQIFIHSKLHKYLSPKTTSSLRCCILRVSYSRGFFPLCKLDAEGRPDIRPLKCAFQCLLLQLRWKSHLTFLIIEILSPSAYLLALYCRREINAC